MTEDMRIIGEEAYRAIKMLTALRRQIDSGFLGSLVDASEYHLRQLRTGKGSDAGTADLAGGAAYYQNLAP